MVNCEDCDQEMLGSKSCDQGLLAFDLEANRLTSKTYKRNTKYFDVNEHCHDCGIENKKGNIHHFGCDMERCPRCKGQLLSCECREEFNVTPISEGKLRS